MPTKRTRIDNRKCEYVSIRAWAATAKILDDLHYTLRESRVQILSYAVKEYHARVMQDQRPGVVQPVKQGVGK